jgi:hypothetical protein
LNDQWVARARLIIEQLDTPFFPQFEECSIHFFGVALACDHRQKLVIRQDSHDCSPLPYRPPDFTNPFNPRQFRAIFSPNPPNLANLPFQNFPFVEILPVAPARLPANTGISNIPKFANSGGFEPAPPLRFPAEFNS